MYGGDPSILVDGDTVYAYVGHDASSQETYYMPDWHCYSSKDMLEWKYEGEILSNSEISWANDKFSSWASQVYKYREIGRANTIFTIVQKLIGIMVEEKVLELQYQIHQQVDL